MALLLSVVILQMLFLLLLLLLVLRTATGAECIAGTLWAGNECSTAVVLIA